MSDIYKTGLVEADFEFKIRVQMRALYKQEEDDELMPSGEYVHVITPGVLMENVIPKIMEAVKNESEGMLHDHLEEYFTFRLFQMLGVKHLPPTVVGGSPSPKDFENPEFVEVRSVSEIGSY